MKRLILILLWLADGINYAGPTVNQASLVPTPVKPHVHVKPISLVMKPMTTTVVQPPGVVFYVVITQPMAIEAATCVNGPWSALTSVAIPPTAFSVPNNGSCLFLRGHFAPGVNTMIVTNQNQ